MVATTAATIAEAEMVGDSSVVTAEVMTEGTIEEEIAVAIGIVRSAITTISHSATNATVVRLSAQAVVEIPVAVTAEATEAATSETIVAVTDAIIAEETVEEIAVGIGIALSARTTTSHSVTNATAAKQIVLVEATEAVHATAEIEAGTAVVATAVATQEVMTVEVQDPQIHEMAAAEEGLQEAIADRADQDSEAQVVAASVVTDRAEAAADVESASPQHSSRLLVSGSYGAKRGDALDRRA